MDSLLNILNTNSKKYKVKNLLIMVDGEGDLASVDELKRDEADDIGSDNSGLLRQVL